MLERHRPGCRIESSRRLRRPARNPAAFAWRRYPTLASKPMTPLTASISPPSTAAWWPSALHARQSQRHGAWPHTTSAERDPTWLQRAARGAPNIERNTATLHRIGRAAIREVSDGTGGEDGFGRSRRGRWRKTAPRAIERGERGDGCNHGGRDEQPQSRTEGQRTRNSGHKRAQRQLLRQTSWCRWRRERWW